VGVCALRRATLGSTTARAETFPPTVRDDAPSSDRL
jgi:hypothetical protein